jgi:Tfp pilus assembly protein FimT
MLKRMRRNPLKAQTTRWHERGFSVLQLLITVAVIAIVSTFAMVSIGYSRSAMRLSASERELASYLEQARTDSIRRHASAPINAGDPDLRAKVTVSANGGNTYTVTMDFDKDGLLDAPRTITLQTGVSFSGIANTIAFDWRGRTLGEVSIGLINERGSTSNINITGSGDITLNTEVFQDEDLPNITLNNNSVSGDVIIDEVATNGAPDGIVTPSTTTDPHTDPDTDTDPPTDPDPEPDPEPDPDPLPEIDPIPKTDPTPVSTPAPCTMSVSSTYVTLSENGGTTINVTMSNLTASNTITATPSNSGQIQVSPSSRTLTTSGTVSFGITVKRNDGSVTFTSSPNCGSATTTLTVN